MEGVLRYYVKIVVFRRSNEVYRWDESHSYPSLFAPAVGLRDGTQPQPGSDDDATDYDELDDEDTDDEDAEYEQKVVEDKNN